MSRRPRPAAPGLFLTGCYRSGTTLLEKLLHAHPQVSVASQPFPLLYFGVKAAFLRERGLERRYPLGHRFLEDTDRLEDFAAFLDRYVVGAGDLQRLAGAMETYAEARWSPQILPLLADLRPGTFLDVWAQLVDLVARCYPTADLALAGTKEVLSEEYLPYLLARGQRGVVILRDPRDMIASYNFRRRATEIESGRPVLFSLRIWRKSVAFALACEGAPGFGWLRYEDLSRQPLEELARLTRLLSLDSYPAGVLRGPLLAQDGSPWSGNSSFERMEAVSTTSVGRFREVLPRETLEFVEYVCAPELRALGYPLASDAADDEDALHGFREPPTAGHPRFEAGYSTDASRLAHEVQRRRMLQASVALDDEEVRRWFVTAEAYARLSATSLGASA